LINEIPLNINRPPESSKSLRTGHWRSRHPKERLIIRPNEHQLISKKIEVKNLFQLSPNQRYLIHLTLRSICHKLAKRQVNLIINRQVGVPHESAREHIHVEDYPCVVILELPFEGK